MSKIIANINLTLDGVMQSPGRADEDTRGGFPYGGWGTAYFDPAMTSQVLAESKDTTGALLFGRRTYQDFFQVWPGRTDNPFSQILDNSQKYVASTTLKDPLPWKNSTLLIGDANAALAALKAKPGPDLLILGSGKLVQSLMRDNLIDEYQLSIHPLVLGTGSRLFPDGSPYASLRLVDTKISSTGVILATYRPVVQ